MTRIDYALTQFLEQKRVHRGASPKTLEAYKSDLEQWRIWSNQQNIEEPTSQNLAGYFSYLNTLQLKTSSLSRKWSALRQFFLFCQSEYQLPKNPMASFPLPKKEKKLPKMLSVEEVQSLLTASESSPRDEVFLKILYASGLRISEAIALTAKDLDLKRGLLKVLGKGSKERFVPIAKPILEKIETYLKETTLPDGRLFPFTRQQGWNILRRIALSAGLGRAVSPHQLRHSFASHLLHSGMNLRMVQALLGHANLTTTQIYTHVESDLLEKTIALHHPRGRSSKD